MVCRADKAEKYRIAKMLNRQTTAAEEITETVHVLEVPAIVESAINEARFIEGDTVRFHVQFSMPEEWLLLELADIAHKALDLIEEHDMGYVFGDVGTNPSKNRTRASFYAYCSLSTIEERKRAEDHKRNDRKRTLYDCKGSIRVNIDMERAVIIIRYAHGELHEPPKEEETRSDPIVVEHIVSHACDSNMTVVFMRRIIKDEYPDTVMTPKQISYWFNLATRSRYVRDEDQIESSRILIRGHETCGYFNVIDIVFL
jgi:hypothetical protein